MILRVDFLLPLHWFVLFLTALIANFFYFLLNKLFWRQNEATGSEQPQSLLPLECSQNIRAFRLKRRFAETVLPSEIDAIVIGSGIGGLTTAAILAKTGRKVVVLERQDQIGGFCQSFIDQGYEWDVGLQYVGQMGQNTFERFLIDQLSQGQLDWRKLDDDFDNVVLVEQLPNSEEAVTIFPIRGDLNNRFLSDLIARYPDHRQRLQQFLAELQKSCRGFFLFYSMLKLWPKWLIRFIVKMGIYKLFTNYEKTFNGETASALLQRLFGPGNHEIKRVLGCYSIEPSRTGFGVLALLYNHFDGGAYYPVGGSNEIPYTLIPTIEQAGGLVLVNANVTKILLKKGNKAVGVQVDTGSGSIVDVKAPIVISDAGVFNTFRHLLPNETAMKTKIGRLLDQGRVRPSLSLFQVFVGLLAFSEMELELPAKNTWIYYGTDLNKGFDDWNKVNLDTAVEIAKIPFLFASFPSAKDTTYNERYPGRSVCTLITTVPTAWYRKWQKIPVNRRGDEFEDVKMRLAGRCWELVVQRYPSLADRLDYIDANFVDEAFGLDHDRQRFSPEIAVELRAKCEIENLYLTGQDVWTGGFVGAIYGGVLASIAALPRYTAIKLITSTMAQFWKRKRR